MLDKSLQIEAVDVYLKKRKSREYVGRLVQNKSKFIFTYDDAYLFKNKSIMLGPDLPLTAKRFSSKELFPSFSDRIPSKQNPAYIDYCKMVGISFTEENNLVLLSTLGHKGPSSFIFAPVYKSNFGKEEFSNFRKKLKLSIREFSDVFDLSAATITRIEQNRTSGKDVLKRMEIYYNFPDVALYEVNKNIFKIEDEKAIFIIETIKHLK